MFFTWVLFYRFTSTISDLTEFTEDDIRLARNEIYARHGRLFKDQELQDYFNSMPWYEGNIPADSFDEAVFNDVGVKSGFSKLLSA